jgi:hypothetical protein
MQNTIERAETALVPYTWAQWINVLLGIAVIATPYIAQANTAALTSGTIIGVVIIIVSLISFFASKTRNGTNISVINVIAGVGLLFSTAFANDQLLGWVEAVYGILIIVTAVIVMGMHSTHLALARRSGS